MKLKKLLFGAATVSLLALASCDKIKDFGNTNVNPNATPVPSTAALLTNVQAGLGGTSTQTRGALYAQQVSETQYTEVSLYSLPRLDFDGIYAGGLMDLQNIININKDDATKTAAAKFGSNANQIAVARILKAYLIWTITDRWGDIPYTEALVGDANLTPKYDKQEDIYKDLIKELTEAKNQLDANAPAVSGDIIYYKPTATTTANSAQWGIAVGRWKKLANSLRMLIALRTSKVYPNAGGWAATNFVAAYNDADGYIASNGDNLTINYPGNVAAFRNPFYNLFESRHDFAESKLMTDLMSTLSDPRQGAFGSSTVGFPYGLTRDAAVAFGSANSNYAEILAASKRTAASPTVVVAASQVLLAVAEAAQRNWIAGVTIATVYRNAIQASWDQWGVSGDITAYTTGANVALTSTASDLQKIQTQQYISYYPDGIQAWSNWRRTAIPALTPTPSATNASKQIPRRYTYGQNEYSVNAAGVADAVTRLGTDTEDKRVWWDQ